MTVSSPRHDYSSTEYCIWRSMRRRCYDSRLPEYKNYGGRGITYCSGWESFDKFYNDMGPRPTGKSLDRIDNGLGYWCGTCEECLSLGRQANCKWSSNGEQHRNRRDNYYISILGETKTLTDWSLISGVARRTIQSRINKGIEPRDAVFGPRPARRSIGLIQANGQTMSVSEWSKKTGLTQGCIYARIDMGYSPELAVTKKKEIK